MSKIMYKDAVRDALIEEMNRDPSIFLLGYWCLRWRFPRY